MINGDHFPKKTVKLKQREIEGGVWSPFVILHLPGPTGGC